MFGSNVRQVADLLFPTRPRNTPGPFPRPLAPGASVVFGPFTLDGYATITVFAYSDQPFTITISEAVVAGGPYVVTQTFASAAFGSLQKINQRFEPSGAAFGKAELTNTGGSGQTILEVQGRGVPIS